MILAHITDSGGGGGGGGGGAVRWVLLILAVAVISAAGRLRTANRPKLQWMALGGLGAALAIGGITFPIEPKQDPIYLTVVTPDDGSLVTANQPVPLDVRVEGGTIASSDTDMTGGHIHIYIDGQLEQMLYTDQPTVTLPPGKHKVKVEYTDEKHRAYKPPVEVEISLDARLPPQTP